MADNTIGWGQGAANNSIGWGKGAANNTIDWGAIYGSSDSGDTDLGGGGGFDADYQAVLDYWTTNAITLPSAGLQALQNAMVVSLKDEGIWSKLDMFGVFATEDSSAALTDWKRLAQMTAVNSPTFATNIGYSSNGTTSYINSLYNGNNDGVNFTLNEAHIGVWNYDGISASSNVLLGAISGLSYTSIRPQSAQFNANTSETIIGATWITAGHGMAVSRSGNKVRVVNGVETSVVKASTTINSHDLYILCINNGGTPGNFCASGKRVSIAHAGGSLTTSETLAFYNILNTYMTSL